jgi:AraC family transcriptional regulator
LYKMHRGADLFTLTFTLFMPSPSVKIIDVFPDPQGVRYDENRWYQQHDQAIVMLNCRAKNIYYPKHWTPLSVKCAFHGTERYHFDKKTIGVCSKNFLILNAGSEYSSSIDSPAPTTSFTINFTPQNIAEVFSGISGDADAQLDEPFRHCGGSPGFVEKLYPHDDIFSSRLATLKNAVEKKDADPSFLMELLYLLLGDMILLYNKTSKAIDQLSAKKRATREELYKRLHTVKDHMDSGYQAEISLHELSEIGLMNSFYLLREFKKAFRVTPHQYITQRRLEEASALLLLEDIPVTRIKERVGFADDSSFCRLFKKKYGCPPGVYRKNMTGRF